MFSQNVVDPREFITDPGENMWDSQQNSQVWSYSQNSSSQVVPFGNNSQSGFRNNSSIQNRPSRSSGGSDYWSQSQNQSQTLQENEDNGKYHLKYLSKPRLFQSNNNKQSEEKGQIKNLQQYVEVERKKSIEQDQRQRLDAIAKTLKEYTEEVHINIGALKSELATEISSISEKFLDSAKEATTCINKFTEDMKQDQNETRLQSGRHQETNETEFQKLQAQIQHLEEHTDDIKSQFRESKEEVKVRLEKEETRMERCEDLLQSILSCVAKRKTTMTETSVQTSPLLMKEVATQSHIDEDIKETQTDESLSLQRFPQNQQIAYQNTSFCQSNDGASMMPFQQSYPSHSGGMEGGIPSKTIGCNIAGYFGNCMTQAEVQFPLPSKDFVPPQLKALSHYQNLQKTQPLSHLSPAQRPLAFSCAVNPSPVAAVVPIVQDKEIKQEERDDCIYNVRRPRSRRNNHTEKKEDSSAIFLFDLCSDMDDSEENIAPSEIPIEQPTKSPLQQKCSPSANKKQDAISKPKVQREITSYGKIKKNNSSEWTKKGPFWKSPKNAPVRNTKQRPPLKAKTKVSSRGSVAQQRKEYAESVFFFDDDSELANIRMAIEKQNTKKRRQPIC